MVRFSEAYSPLGFETKRQPGEATEIFQVLDGEVAAINQALAEGKEPSEVYASLKDQSKEFLRITWRRPPKWPNYLSLAKINWDHFGADARTAYNAGHLFAMHHAVNYGLESAYAMNAFADHFLEDSFSAGHIRTPRRLLHDLTGFAALCAKFMHDEENAIGLNVTNPLGRSWRVYGDKRLLDKEDVHNKNEIRNALQASADEIYQAWKTKKIPKPEDFAAWQHVPKLDPKEIKSDINPFIRPDGQRRTPIEQRCSGSYTNDFYYWSTDLECETSGLWNFPIKQTEDCDNLFHY